MLCRDHPEFYESNSSLSLKTSFQMSSKDASDPKVTQEGPRTPSTQNVESVFVAKMAQEGTYFETQNRTKSSPKSCWMLKQKK